LSRLAKLLSASSRHLRLRVDRPSRCARHRPTLRTPAPHIGKRVEVVSPPNDAHPAPNLAKAPTSMTVNAMPTMTPVATTSPTTTTALSARDRARFGARTATISISLGHDAWVACARENGARSAAVRSPQNLVKATRAQSEREALQPNRRCTAKPSDPRHCELVNRLRVQHCRVDIVARTTIPSDSSQLHSWAPHIFGTREGHNSLVDAVGPKVPNRRATRRAAEQLPVSLPTTAHAPILRCSASYVRHANSEPRHTPVPRNPHGTPVCGIVTGRRRRLKSPADAWPDARSVAPCMTLGPGP